MNLAECTERTRNFFFDTLNEAEEKLRDLHHATEIPYIFITTEELQEKVETLMRLAVRLQTLMGMNFLSEHRKEQP